MTTAGMLTSQLHMNKHQSAIPCPIKRQHKGRSLSHSDNFALRAEKLKRKRHEFEEANKGEMERKRKATEAARRQEATLAESRALVAHVLACHSSFYGLLQARSLAHLVHARSVCFLADACACVHVSLKRYSFSTMHAKPLTLCVQIPENSSVDVIKRARKQLSFRVHPDRCKLPQAKEAFHRVNEAADALLQHRA